MRHARFARLPCSLLALFCAVLPAASQPGATPQSAPPSAPSGGAAARCAHELPPKELFEIERVVDGDTLWVRRKGEVEKLRLLSVDTEERLGKGHSASATKPQTVFGEETALWAQELFAKLAKEGEKARVGLIFPGGKEQRDVFGRILCHVLLPDGTDYNLLLVKQGRSPYFDKYGNDEVDHAAFVRAQAAAQERQLGIWDPRTNAAGAPDQPSARRPYELLLPWWNARAEAIEGFRKHKAAQPEACFHAEDKGGLARAAKAGAEVEVFGEVGKTFDEASGDLTVLLRGADSDHDVRVRIPAARRTAHASIDFKSLAAEFHQNYVFVRGKVTDDGRGFHLVSEAPERWRKAGPEPRPVPAPEPIGAGAR